MQCFYPITSIGLMCAIKEADCLVTLLRLNEYDMKGDIINGKGKIFKKPFVSRRRAFISPKNYI